MANVVMNCIQITGDDAEITRFIDHVHTEHDGEVCVFDLDRLEPMPKELQVGNAPMLSPDDTRESLKEVVDDETTDDYVRKNAATKILMLENIDRFGFSSWYDWSIAKWGTKWNVDCDSDWSVGDGNAALFYESAWSPPQAAILAGSKLFPGLSIVNYAMDPAMDWASKTTFVDGVMEDFTGTLSESQEVLDVFGFDLDQMLGEDDEDEE
jgi:hypothetical protein